MKVIPYLNFDGQCAEAFLFYERVLEGRIQGIMTHGESPMAAQVPPEWHPRVLHAYLVLDGAELMASDSPPGRHQPAQGTHVSLTIEDEARAERVFHALAEGGTVTMPLQPTFWAPRFGMLVDRFGIPWMVSGGSATA